MAETKILKRKIKRWVVRHRGRGSQMLIYLGKQFRMFIYQNDWKVLPMAAIIAALVSIVLSSTFFITMEGTVFGAFAISCVCLWNGCFNSIQVVCRERDIIKREHRSGMHISSYVAAHMVYQAALCLAQTAITIFVTERMGIQYPKKGFFFHSFFLDYGITLFLITYAADMIGLFISSVSTNTTVAMTVMPFILIFQLVFSGGFFTLPEWVQPVEHATISSYGIKTIAAQGDYNNLPVYTAWNNLVKMAMDPIEGDVSVNDALNILRSEPFQTFLSEQSKETGVPVDELLNMVLNSETMQEIGTEKVHVNFRLADLINAVGEDTIRDYFIDASRQAGYKAEYVRSAENIGKNWLILGAFAVGFAILSVVVLEFIDKDKR